MEVEERRRRGGKKEGRVGRGKEGDRDNKVVYVLASFYQRQKKRTKGRRGNGRGWE